VARTSYWDVLVMTTPQSAHEFLAALQESVEHDATLINAVARVVPVTDTFSFDSPEAFREGVTRVALPWAEDLAGKRFYVRMHRRGFKGRLSSTDEERALGDALLRRVHEHGGTATVAFERPDWVIVIETVDSRAGLSRWARDDLERYELLRIH
jgi:tRNA(Ser,Leu) C12 N-acetylase TAN1